MFAFIARHHKLSNVYIYCVWCLVVAVPPTLIKPSTLMKNFLFEMNNTNLYQEVSSYMHMFTLPYNILSVFRALIWVGNKSKAHGVLHPTAQLKFGFSISSLLKRIIGSNYYSIKMYNHLESSTKLLKIIRWLIYILIKPCWSFYI